MRTKTLILAAAALAATLATQAQSNVYSVNVVGYINVPMAANTTYLLENALDNATNTLASIDNGAIPNKSTANIWNGTGFTGGNKTAGVWPVALSGVLPPGTAFFVKPASACTVTFVGSAPTSNNYVLAANVQAAVGAVLPIAGYVTNAGANTINLAGIPAKSSINVWNGTGFTGGTKVAGAFPAVINGYLIDVAKGFFLKPTASYTWIQYLQ